MSGVVRLLSGNGLPGISGFSGGVWPAEVLGLRPSSDLGASGLWHWWAFDDVLGLAPVGDRLLPLPLGDWRDGDYFPDGCLLGLGGSHVRCSYGSGVAPVGECVLRPDGELVLGSGVIRESLSWGSAEPISSLSSDGESQIWLGGLRPGLDLLLFDRCSYGLLVCHKVLTDSDLPGSASPGEFWLSLSSGRLVCPSGVFEVLGFGSCDQPGVSSFSVPVSGSGYGTLPLGLLDGGVGELFVFGKRDPVTYVSYDTDLPVSVRGTDSVYLSRSTGNFRLRGSGSVTWVRGRVSLSVSGVGLSLLGLAHGPWDLASTTDVVYELDGVFHTVSLAAGRYTASEIAVLLGSGWSVCGLGLALTGVLSCGVLSGGCVFGFGDNWIGGVRNSYYGLQLGLYRQVGDLDLNLRVYRDLTNQVLVSDVNASPYIYVGSGFPSNGIAEFKIYGTNGRVATCDGLGSYGSWGVGVRLDCLAGDRLFWFRHFDTGGVPVGPGFSSFAFEGQGVLPDTISLTVQEPGGPWLPHEYELLGSSGAVLVSRIAPVNLTGLVGSSVSGVFTDPLISDYSACESGGLLVTSDNTGYVITGVAVGVGGVSLSPGLDFGPVSWEARGSGALLANAQFTPVSVYLNPAPFEIRVVGGETLVEGMTIRYGAYDAGDEALNMLVRGVDCGEIAGVFSLPAFVLADDHFLLSPVGGPWVGFSLRVPGSVVTVVSSFTVPEPLPGVIEVQALTGVVHVASDLLQSYAGLTVLYDQEFLPSSLIYVAEGNLATGAINIPDTHAGDSYYLVEKLGAPVATLNPVAGTVYMTRPVRAGELVEARYYPTDSGGVSKTGDLVIEFLPVVIRLESATRIDSKTYSFNSSGLVYDPNTAPLIWVDADLQNYSGVVTTTVANGNEIRFDYDVPASASVQITYAVLDCPPDTVLQTYSVSRAPVWQPPFWLVAGQDSFTLEGDRTGGFLSPGHLIAVGGFVPFVQSAVYADGVTTVEISPAPTVEVGSRSPGRDSGLLVSDVPVTSFTAIAGGVLPAGRGASSVLLPGAVQVRANQVLLLDSWPYMVRGSQLSPDGRQTEVLLSTPLSAAVGSGASVSLSNLPVYPVNPVQFELAGGVLGVAPTVVQFPAVGAGVVLARDTDYTIDANGLLTLRSALPLEGRLYVAYTRVRALTPTVIDGAVVTPSYRVVYDSVIQPSAENYLLGGSLTGTYRIYDPEVFSLAYQTMADFLPVVQLDAAKYAGDNAASASPLVFPQGSGTRLSLQTENPRNAAWDALNLDAGGRVFVGLFDQAVVPFEQVLETIDGRLIGDRDGKFRFYVGAESLAPDPGGVYLLTSHMRPRVIWQDIMAAWSPNTSGWVFSTDDVIYDPRTISESGVNPGQPVGTPPTSDVLADFMARQRDFIRNDIDDVVMTRFRRTVRNGATLFPVIDFKGVFQGAWEPSLFSRVYPEQSRYFTRLLPGVEAGISPDTGEVLSPGIYTAGRVVTVPGDVPGTVKNQVVKTRNTVIGQVSNPVLGEITRLSDVTASDRGFRFRVWRYYPVGLTPAQDLALGISTAGYATVDSTVGSAADSAAYRAVKLVLSRR